MQTRAHQNNSFLSKKMMKLSFILSALLLLSACSTIRYDGVSLDKKGNTLVSAIVTEDVMKIEELRKAIMTLGPNIVPSEANFVAREAVLHPKILANRYKLMSPPLFHNVLVNYGKRPRGLCWQWTHDMGKQINRPMKSLQFFHAVAFRRNYWKEHSTLAVRQKAKEYLIQSY